MEYSWITKQQENWPKLFFSTEIAQLEYLAALRALESLVTMLRHSWIILFIDNRVAVCTVTCGGSCPWQKDIARFP